MKTPAEERTPMQARIRSVIVATIGPASESPVMVRRLVEAGVSIFRFNFSHGTFDDHERRLRTVRSVAEELGRPIACLGDLPGPKIRVGRVPEPGIVLEPGCTVALTARVESARVEEAGGERVVTLPCTYEAIAEEVQPGQRVLINDGLIRLLATEVSPELGVLRCVVTSGGLVTSRKGVNLPESDISAAALSDRDHSCVEWSVEHGLDFLALSFVKSAEDVRLLKACLSGMCPRDRAHGDDESGGASAMLVIAKIERPQAVRDIQSIVAEADGIMVARGDLGVEMDIAQVPIAQKRILSACQSWGRPSIVATQMLETMIEHPTPTRAEASDVANAIFDGADCVMLSGETATGRHPALVVETMRRIVAAAEARQHEEPPRAGNPSQLAVLHHRTAAVAHGAWHVAHDVGASLIACWSQNGGTARYLSQNDFRVPIVAYSSSARATRRMALLAGVTAVRADPPASGLVADWVEFVNEDLVRRGFASIGDKAVLLAGRPVGRVKATNGLLVHEFH